MARMIDQQVTAKLEELGVAWQRIDCDPALADTAAFCAHYGYPLADCANTIIVASRKEPKQYSACVVLGDTRLDVNHTVSRLMGIKRLSFATAEETEALTGMTIGGVTVFGLPEALPVYLDSAVMRRESLILGGGSRNWKIRMPPSDLLRLSNLQVVEGLAMEKTT
ncbi:MAG TPA: YbaK/EbsC family protein [Thermoanaerobaculia bacterium]|nr:YbaK/EbsC family protein [Thermoanaerobaculia bacterium]